jgi:hypothetical protein
MYWLPHFSNIYHWILDNVISNQLQNELNEYVKGNKRIECLSQKDCKHIEERCCYTFLDPRSKCYKTCPLRWKEIVNGNEDIKSRSSDSLTRKAEIIKHKTPPNLINSRVSMVQKVLFMNITKNNIILYNITANVLLRFNIVNLSFLEWCPRKDSYV